MTTPEKIVNALLDGETAKGFLRRKVPVQYVICWKDNGTPSKSYWLSKPTERGRIWTDAYALAQRYATAEDAETARSAMAAHNETAASARVLPAYRRRGTGYLESETPKEFLRRKNVQAIKHRHGNPVITRRAAEERVAAAEPLIDHGFRHEHGDNIVECPACHHTGWLMDDWSLLFHGYNGIQQGDADDVNMQECGVCGVWSTWQHLQARWVDMLGDETVIESDSPKEFLARTSKVRRLTLNEIERLVDIFASGPLTRQPEDQIFFDLGLVQAYDDMPDTVDAADGAHARVFNKNGSMRDEWFPKQ